MANSPTDAIVIADHSGEDLSMELIARDQPFAERLLADSWTSNSPRTLEECTAKHAGPSDQSMCSEAWDSFFCWPPTEPGSLVSVSCKAALETMGVPATSMVTMDMDHFKAFRSCNSSGHWVSGNWTNYTQCLDLLVDDQENVDHSLPTALLVGYILFICSIVSLIFMAATLFIFFYFKSLECPRLRVHRNLVIALVLHSMSLLAISSPLVFGGDLLQQYASTGWLCKFVLCLKMYSALASINWMFIEGLMLHSRVTTKIFEQKFPFKTYYLVGWGIPIMIIVAWAIKMFSELSGQRCWEGYADLYFVWIITGPMIAALLINCAFLISIIRVLITKVRRSSSVETTKFKAIKATLLLFPLLGITHLLFCFNPKNNKLEGYYMVTNATLQSSQGIFVSILYCFMNSDVRRVLRNCYMRAETRRSVATRSSFAGSTRSTTVRRKNGVQTVVVLDGGATAVSTPGFRSGRRKSNSFPGTSLCQLPTVQSKASHASLDGHFSGRSVCGNFSGVDTV